MLNVLRDVKKQRCNTRLFLQYHLSREDWRHVQVGSSAGAAPLWKDIKGAQSLVQTGQKSVEEGKAKN